MKVAKFRIGQRVKLKRDWPPPDGGLWETPLLKKGRVLVISGYSHGEYSTTTCAWIVEEDLEAVEKVCPTCGRKNR